MSNESRKADLIKSALKIVDELADLELDEVDDIDELIDRANKLKRDRLWKLN